MLLLLLLLLLMSITIIFNTELHFDISAPQFKWYGSLCTAQCLTSRGVMEQLLFCKVYTVRVYTVRVNPASGHVLRDLNTHQESTVVST